MFERRASNLWHPVLFVTNYPAMLDFELPVDDERKMSQRSAVLWNFEIFDRELHILFLSDCLAALLKKAERGKCQDNDDWADDQHVYLPG